MYPPQKRKSIQHHCYVGQGFLVMEEVFLVTGEVFLVMEERVLVTEEGFLVTGEVFLVMEEVFLVVEDKVCFFVYRLALDAKPDRGML